MQRLRAWMKRKLRWICYGRPEQLWQRYVVGFIFIFATISISHWSSLATITAAEDDTEVLSVSSRQRMLSQRILFLMNEMDHDFDPFIEQRLESALDLFESSHNWLVSYPDLSPQLEQLYFDKQPISLDEFSRRFVQMVGIAAYAEGAQKEELQKVLAKWGKEDLISYLATAADLFRQESEKRISRLQNIQQITLIAALVVLLVEALLIFVPAQLTVNFAIRRLKRRKAQLSKSMQKLRDRNNELLSARQNLLRAANHDALTGLYNRRAVYEKLSETDIAASMKDDTRCVMKLDLDLFKEINDTLGHNAGDQVLVHTAQAIKKASGAGSFVGRIGGDEFVVIVEQPQSVAAVEKRAESILDELGKPQVISNRQIRVGASIGFTIAAPSAATPDQMLIEADLALYEAKRTGRDRVCAYSDALAADMETRRMLFEEITLALKDDQFEPYLMPQVYTETGALYGCEVLARWRHPEKGIVPPATFIAAAEEAGLVDQIDRIMIEKGLDLLERFDEQGIVLPSLSVNAAPSTLRDPYLPERLCQEIQARHLSPDRLTVEVLESTLIENDDDIALNTIERLSNMGFSVVLDDFGTGYASMSNLSRLKLNGIKLDQSLVKLVPEPRANSIIEALVTLSRNLGMCVVAEGVETARQFDGIRNLGCHVVQGYLVGRPMDQDEFLAWFEQHTAASQDHSKRA